MQNCKSSFPKFALDRRAAPGTTTTCGLRQVSSIPRQSPRVRDRQEGVEIQWLSTCNATLKMIAAALPCGAGRWAAVIGPASCDAQLKQVLRPLWKISTSRSCLGWGDRRACSWTWQTPKTQYGPIHRRPFTRQSHATMIPCKKKKPMMLHRSPCDTTADFVGG